MEREGKNVRLDAATRRALQMLADQRTEGNCSMIMRQLIQREAKAVGIWPVALADQSEASSGTHDAA